MQYNDEFLDHYEAVKRNVLIKLGSGFGETKVYCPHCGEGLPTPAFKLKMDDWTDAECPDCLLAFKVRARIVFDIKRKGA